MTSIHKPLQKLLTATAIAAALAACQTTPPANADLQNARDTVAQARANPATVRTAGAELDRAQQALQRAEMAWTDRRDSDETRHLSYLAQRRAEIANAVALQATADERVQQAGAERERMRLEARTREADMATQAALVAQANARRAQGLAELSKKDAEASRQDAEAARQAADAARSSAVQQAQVAATQSELAAAQAERAAALERDLQALQARPTNRGIVVTLGDVLFASGSANLEPVAVRSVDQLAEVLQHHPERRVLIEGFTDSQGSDARNLELSQRRADALRRALLNAGIRPDRMDVRAHGEADPVADNSTPTGRQLNRRVEIVFSDGQGRFATR